MRRWEVSGEVPDSDDEDPILLDRPLHLLDINIAGQAPRSQAQCNIDKENARDPRSRTPPEAQPRRSFWDDIDTSSIGTPSVISHTDAQPPASPTYQDAVFDFDSDSPLSPAPPSPSPARPASYEEIQQLREVIAAETHARSLRQRTAQQLHPYQLEQARYLQQCRARGMRPVKVVGARMDMAPLSSQASAAESFVPSPSRLRDSTVPLFESWEPTSSEHSSLTAATQSASKRRRLNETSYDIYDVPLSPPSSPPDFQVPVEKVARFRYPSGMAPIPQLPTPRVSSEVRPVATPARGTPSDEDTSDTEQDIFATQKKRIRGVLPASWLKVDWRAQQERSTAPARNLEPLPAKGVAKRLTKRPGRTLSHVLSISGDSESEVEQPPQYRQQVLRLDAAEGPVDFVDVDDMEHDFVDPLLASSSRVLKQRQPKIRDAFAGPTAQKRRQRDKSERGPARPRTIKPPRLSILDATTSSAPQFVRVAARQARQAPRQGRQSPASKHIQLATRQDTEDGLQTLRQWREGTIAPVETAVRAPIKPPVRKQTIVEALRPQPRNVQVEDVETGLDAINRAANFNERLEALTVAAQARAQPAAGRLAAAKKKQRTPRAIVNAAAVALSTRQPSRQRQRKRPTRRIDTEEEQYQLLVEVAPAVIPVTDLQQDSTAPLAPVFDFSGVHTPFSLDFGVRPLSHACQDTFVTSGDFADAIRPSTRSYDEPAGWINIETPEHTCTWSAWNSTVKSELQNLVEILSCSAQETEAADHDATAQAAEYILRSMVRYCTSCLYFHDPIDRSDCIAAFLDACGEFNIAAACATPRLHRMILQYALVLAIQQAKLSRESTSELRNRCQATIQASASQLSRLLVSNAKHGPLLDLYVHTILILNHCLQVSDASTSFWTVINESLQSVHSLFAVNIEEMWHTTFRMCPALALNEYGNIVHKPRTLPEDWSLLRSTTKAMLDTYDATHAAGAPINAYLKTLIMRSQILITNWHWRKCEIWLATLYDFFVQRKLSLLKAEVSSGSPAFLDNLTSQPDLKIMPSDNSMHMFLKVVATSIQEMSQHAVYASRKLRSVMWRLIPGHPHDYRKENDMSEADADRLRNHYDLLSTLYFAAPSSARIELNVLTGLVDYETSHRAACRLSVKAWARLASYQASLNEPLERLDGFCEWYMTIVKATVTQYCIARSEAEEDFYKLRANNKVDISTAELDRVVASNQRHIAATLVDALAGLKRTIQNAHHVEGVVYITARCQYWTYLLDFDIADRTLKSVWLEVLEVTLACLQQLQSTPSIARQQTEDSQDYGDDSALQAFANDMDGCVDYAQELLSIVTPVLSQLISNMFGSEQCPDEVILSKGIDAWLALLSQSVSRGKLSWEEVIGGYGSTSWRQLRDTAQHRSMTPYFLAAVVSNAGDDIIVQSLLPAWLKALVVRESALRHQHRLTSAILNKWLQEPVLHNLPFTRDSNTHRYCITLHDLQQRRLSTIAGLLSNMRESIDQATSSKRLELKTSYAEAVREMMNAMKSNYTELQDCGSVANGSVQGEYVSFVQNIVALMQQHTTGICQIDRFFTDSTVFPLPAEDPTYVVGRLKGYAARLDQEKTQKELAVFLVTVCERAVIDGQEQYLIDQMLLASGDELEIDIGRPSLRSFLLTVVVPAYLQAVREQHMAWRVATVVMDFTRLACRKLMSQVKFNDEQSKRAIGQMASSVIAAVTKAVQALSGDSGGIGRWLLSRAALVCQELVVLSEYLSKTDIGLRKACACLEWLAQQASPSSSSDADGLVVSTPAKSITAYVTKLITDSLSKSWKTASAEGHIMLQVQRNGMTKTIASPQIEDGAETQKALKEFSRAYYAVFVGRERPLSFREKQDPWQLLVI